MIATFRSLVDPEALAAVIDTAYGIRVRSCVLLRSLVNDVYRIETADGPLAFKLYSAGHRTPDEVVWEVGSPRRGRAGAGPGQCRSPTARRPGRSTTAEGVRPYSLWHWAPGGQSRSRRSPMICSAATAPAPPRSMPPATRPICRRGAST